MKEVNHQNVMKNRQLFQHLKIVAVKVQKLKIHKKLMNCLDQELLITKTRCKMKRTSNVMRTRSRRIIVQSSRYQSIDFRATKF